MGENFFSRCGKSFDCLVYGFAYIFALGIGNGP